MPTRLDRTAGKTLFALNTADYELARPDYPEALYQWVIDNVGSLKGSTVLEIGPGNGLASKRILQMEVGQLTLVEPDTRFQPILEGLKSSTKTSVNLVFDSFEQMQGEAEQYDFVFAATSFHWLQPDARLKVIGSLLKPNGHAVLLWNVFGDASQPDPFHDATQHLFHSVPISPSHEDRAVPFALDTEARLREFKASDYFDEPVIKEIFWPLEIGTLQMLALYRTFSGINSLPVAAREELLAGLEKVAREQFNGRVIRNMTSIAYVASKSASATGRSSTK